MAVCIKMLILFEPYTGRLIQDRYIKSAPARLTSTTRKIVLLLILKTAVPVAWPLEETVIAGFVARGSRSAHQEKALPCRFVSQTGIAINVEKPEPFFIVITVRMPSIGNPVRVMTGSHSPLVPLIVPLKKQSSRDHSVRAFRSKV